MLVFDVELISFMPVADRNRLPDVKAAPADAKRTASGLAYKVLKPGTGATPPAAPSSMVTVHYSGWTTDGKNVRQLGRARAADHVSARRRDHRAGPRACS